MISVGASWAAGQDRTTDATTAHGTFQQVYEGVGAGPIRAAAQDSKPFAAAADSTRHMPHCVKWLELVPAALQHKAEHDQTMFVHLHASRLSPPARICCSCLHPPLLACCHVVACVGARPTQHACPILVEPKARYVGTGCAVGTVGGCLTKWAAEWQSKGSSRQQLRP